MENWRLSRIEVELGKLKLDLESPDVVSTSPEAQDVRKSPIKAVQTETRSEEDDLLSKIVIRPAYSRVSLRKVDAHKAIRKIKEKYDSPNAVTKSAPSVEPSQPTSAGDRVTNETTGALNPSEPDVCRIQPQPVGPRFEAESSPMLLPVCKSSTVKFSPPAVARGDFDFNTTVHHPTFPNETTTPLSSAPRSPSRPGPPIASKPSFSMYLGQSMPQRRHEPAKLSSAHSFPYTGEEMASSPAAAFHPPDLLIVQQFVSNDSPSSFSLPAPPSDVFSPEYPLAQFQALSPTSAEPTVDFRSIPTVRQKDENCLRDASSPGNKEMLHTVDESLDDRDGSADGKLDHFFRRRNEVEQSPCEPVSMETHTIRHLADSYNCRPRFGTLRATRANSSRGVESKSCDFFPPNGPCLTDDDRNQVEMFYRSHKTRVFTAKCEVNLYFGSARRHSAVVARKSAAACATESPENWMFLKCGVPVLVLDSGESRRQRRLHIILAERGSGFVLWRDSFDHLTGYSVSANVGFHTMHLSKDHTKLAGFYFADSLSATEFFDCLRNLTSDPDDPLLSLSNGTRKKKKDRKAEAGGSSRKEKRKPIRREDISLPCCFTHITKLDHNDGLNILLSDDRLLQHSEKNSQVEPSSK